MDLIFLTSERAINAEFVESVQLINDAIFIETKTKESYSQHYDDLEQAKVAYRKIIQKLEYGYEHPM